MTIPIVMPLAYALRADIPLTIGALLSASAFASQACFYGDSTVLAAQGGGLQPDQPWLDPVVLYPDRGRLGIYRFYPDRLNEA